jgi:hypothetical protein
MIAAAAVAGGFALLAPQAAGAATDTASVTVPAGNRVCVDSSASAYFKARGEGLANPGVKFTFLVRPVSQSAYTQLAESGSNTTNAFAAEANRTYTPWAFPGYFRICARNFGPGPASVQVSVRTDY